MKLSRLVSCALLLASGVLLRLGTNARAGEKDKSSPPPTPPAN